MFDTGLFQYLLPLLGIMTFAEGGGGGTGDGDGGTGDNGAEGDKISKEDHQKVVDDLTKKDTELEDMRLEVMSPEYVKFLESQEKPKEDEKPVEDTTKDDDFEKLSKKDLFLKAKEAAKSEMKKDLDEARNTYTKEQKDRTKQEVSAFARSHEDYELYRPTMYRLSLDPKNQTLTMLELYNKSKDYVKRIHAGTTEADKEKQRKLKGEKPGGSSESYEELAKMTPEKATAAAVAEVKEKLGPMPSA